MVTLKDRLLLVKNERSWNYTQSTTSLYFLLNYTFLRLNVNSFERLTKESHKNACQKHDGADHWYFGSIAQIARAAVDFALGEWDWGIRRLAQHRFISIACRRKAAAFSVDRNGCTTLFSGHKGFSTAVLTTNTGNLLFLLITVSPVFESETLVALQAVSDGDTKKKGEDEKRFHRNRVERRNLFCDSELFFL